jgi:Flp pilus assembly pilin Flp
MKKFLAYLKNEKGIETLEWILIGGLITAVAVVVYPGTLQPQLVNAVNAVGGAIVAAVGGGS